MRIEEARKQLESLQVALNRETYLFFSGRKERLDTAEIYSIHSDLLTRESIDELAAAAEGPGTLPSRRRSYQRIHSFAVEQRLNAACSALTEEIARRESGKCISWRKRNLHYHQIPSILANEADASARRSLNDLRLHLLEETRDLRTKQIEKLRMESRALGFAGYQDAYQNITGIDYRGLESTLESLRERTERPYRDRLSASARSVLGMDLESVQRCDIAYWFRMQEFDRFFPEDRMVSGLAQTLQGIGIDLEGQKNVQLDLEPRPNKYSRPFCAPVRIPEEIYIVVNLRGGQDDLASLLHEAGHAQHFSWTSPSLMAEDAYWGDRGLSEAFAFLFESLLRDPQWLSTVVGFAESAGLRRHAALLRNQLVRRYCAKLSFEMLLHAASEPADSAPAYVEKLLAWTGIRHEPESYLEDMDEGFYAAEYIRAWIFEVLLREHLRSRFGSRWFANRKAGSFLREIWETGQLYRLEELSAQIGTGPLDPDVLAGDLLQELT